MYANIESARDAVNIMIALHKRDYALHLYRMRSVARVLPQHFSEDKIYRKKGVDLQYHSRGCQSPG